MDYGQVINSKIYSIEIRSFYWNLHITSKVQNAK